MANTADNNVKDVKKKDTAGNSITSKNNEKKKIENKKTTEKTGTKKSTAKAKSGTTSKSTSKATGKTSGKTVDKTTSKSTGKTAGKSAVKATSKKASETTGKTTSKKTATSKTAQKTKVVTTKKTSNKTSPKEKKVVDENSELQTNQAEKNEKVEEVKSVIDEVKEESFETDDNSNSEDNGKFDTISLKEVREALENKVNKKQKRTIIKEVLINLGLAISMIVFLIVLMVGKNNIMVETLDKDMKIITLSILAIGIFLLEVSYKKDKFKIAMNGIEVLVFGASNLCLIYIAKLYSRNFIKSITYIGVAFGVYYLIKIITLIFGNIKKYKNDNNDIKDIIQKKKKIEE